jgi:hypothetical protein
MSIADIIANCRSGTFSDPAALFQANGMTTSSLNHYRLLYEIECSVSSRREQAHEQRSRTKET